MASYRYVGVDGKVRTFARPMPQLERSGRYRRADQPEPEPEPEPDES